MAESKKRVIETSFHIQAKGEVDAVTAFYRDLFKQEVLENATGGQSASLTNATVDSNNEATAQRLEKDTKFKSKCLAAMEQFNQSGFLVLIAVLNQAREYAQENNDEGYLHADYTDIKTWYGDNGLDINERQIANRIGALRKQTDKLELAPMAVISRDSFETNVLVPVWAEELLRDYAHHVGADQDDLSLEKSYLKSRWCAFLYEIHGVNSIEEESFTDYLRGYVARPDF